MLVIGADTHKRNHMLVAVDGQTAALRGQREIAASDAGSLDGLRFAGGLDEERVWAIEDCRHVCARLSGADRRWGAGDPGAGRDDRPGPEGLPAGGKV